MKFFYVRYIFACLIGVFLYPSPIEGEIKFCLTMMVKNDEAVIERCLNNVKDIADCISICDVGSTDNTVTLIEQFMQKTGIPGKIHRQQWQDSAYNRTLAAQTAQKMLKELGFSLSETYLLLLDADMILNTTSRFKKDALEAESYLLLEHSSALDCYTYRTHLLHASLPWVNRGTLGGSWVCRGPHQVAKLPTLTIENRDDGGFTADQWDIKFIKQNLKNEPSNPSYILHLAHLYRRHRHYNAAIDGYKSYLERGKDKEELWFAKYLIGKCFEEIGQWDEANRWYLEAYQYNPRRREPLLKIATHYRNNSQNDLAYLFAKRGSLIKPAQDQLLFDTSPLHDYQFDEELSISSYYTNHKEDGYAAASTLLIKKNVPWNVKYQAYKNVLCYVQPLKCSRFSPINFEFPLVQEGSEERFRPMNPSLHKTAQGYKVICRTVNYTQKRAVSFHSLDADGLIRSRNFLLHYDRDLNMLSHQEIVEKLPRERIFNWVVGMEDCRIVEFNDHSWFTCTTSDTNPTGQRQISLCKLADKNWGGKIPVVKLIPLQGPDPHRCEKNWLPFVKDGSFYVIYSCHPFTIYKPNLETGSCETVLMYEPEHDFSGFRGSAAPIEYKDGYLMLVHETVQFEDQSRNYLHRFLYLDKNFIVQQVSKPFIFFHRGIEFCCSMTIDHSETALVMAVGIEDREAYLYTVSLETVQSLLTPLN